MKHLSCWASGAAAIVLAVGSACSLHLEQRNAVAPLRAGYNNAFFHRHNPSYRTGAAIHIAHAEQHDALVFDDLAEAAKTDRKYSASWREELRDPPRIEPEMMDYAQHSGQAMWRLYLAIDWTHVHHEQTYEILSDDDVSWPDKANLTDKAVSHYLSKLEGVARSPAPLDVTMRRAGVMMKPYFGIYRSSYPESAKFFYAAHWWHPAVYEAMMIAGNDAEQDQAVGTIQKVFSSVVEDPPSRMLLSREMMPRYSRMSPESANIFDNLHMLHGIAYAILAYEGWSIDDKRAEMYRVLGAMSEKPGDRWLSRRFDIPHPEMDPRRYEPWMKGYEGSMNRIMEQMLEEMWPMMSPDGSKEVPAEVMEQLRKKLRPGLEPGEHPGSLHAALMKVEPGMKMSPESKEAMKPGKSHPKMVEMMLMGWREKTASLPSVVAQPMQSEPSLASLSGGDR